MLSKEFLLEREYCCGNGCLMCPYIPKHIKGNMNTYFLQNYKEEYLELRIYGERYNA